MAIDRQSLMKTGRSNVQLTSYQMEKIFVVIAVPKILLIFLVENKFTIAVD